MQIPHHFWLEMMRQIIYKLSKLRTVSNQLKGSPMKALIISISLLVSSLALANNSFVYTAKISAVDVYNVMNDSTLQGSYSNGTVEETLVGSIFGKVINYQGTPTQVTDSLAHVTMNGIGKESLLYVDTKEGIRRTVQATVERSFFTRSLKAMMIPAEQMKALLAESLKKKGQSLVTQSGMKVGESLLQYNVDVSDYVCVRKDAVMSCNVEAVIKMSLK